MILDDLAQWKQYAAISPHFAQAFAFLRGVKDHTAAGRYEIEGDTVFAFVQKHRTRPLSRRQFEAHRRYIDVQYIHRGQETIHWAPLASLTKIVQRFDREQDAALYGLTPASVPVRIRAGQFAILFPADGHVPSCAWGKSDYVHKVVVKVLASARKP